MTKKKRDPLMEKLLAGFRRCDPEGQELMLRVLEQVAAGVMSAADLLALNSQIDRSDPEWNSKFRRKVAALAAVGVQP